MKQVPPFYANRPDDLSCMLSCMRSALEHFTGQQYSWEQLEELIGFKLGKAAWTVKLWTDLAKQAFDIRMIEPFDYPRYQAEGRDYLRSYLDPEALAWQEQNSNVLEINALLPDFLKYVHQEVRSPQLADIDAMLEEGYLVAVQLNSRILNDRDGYVAHMILVYDKDGDDYLAHDPGLPPRASRRIPANKVLEAMGGKDNTAEVTGLKWERLAS